MERDKDQDHHF